MSLARVFAHALVRRVAFVVVALAFGVIGQCVQRAHAQTNPYNPTTIMNACKADKASYDRTVNGLKYISGSCTAYHGLYDMVNAGTAPNSCLPGQTTTDPKRGVICLPKWRCSEAQPGNCAPEGVSQWGYLLDSACATGTQVRTDENGAHCDVPCSEEPPQTNWVYDDQHQTACFEGCSYDGGINLPDGNVEFIPNGSSCTVGPSDPAPVLDSDGDGTPDNTDDFPNDPTEDTDTDGDGVGDNNDTDPGDPTNGGDDGTGNESDNASSGGGTCASAPTCSGDAIACNALFQQWKTRCAAETTNSKLDGVVDAIEVIGPIGGGGEFTDLVDGDLNGNNVPDYLEGSEGDTSAGDTDLWGEGTSSSWTPDEAGFGLSRTCPSPPTFVLGGASRTIDTSGLCELAGIIGALVLLMAAAHAMWALAQS